MASERNPLSGRQRIPRPRALVWDLFGDHLRYVGDGRIPMRALSALLGVFGVGDSTSRVLRYVAILNVAQIAVAQW